MGYLLAGDIGGTKTILGVYDPVEGPHRPLAAQTFASGRYDCLETMVAEFLAANDYPIQLGSLGLAGPVADGQATITNLPWQVDAARLRQRFGVTAVHLLNDLEAVASAVPYLKREHLHTLNPGRAKAEGAIAVIAPGTGLGEAYLTWDGQGYRARPSEGGHSDFAPTNRDELALLSYLREKRGFEHVSYENVCSGRGIPNLYAFFRDTSAASEPGWLSERLADAGDLTPAIVTAALNEENPAELAVASLNAFVSILGAEAGNLALKVLATGGVYLGGGIPPRIIPLLENGLFLKAFRHKGKLSDFMETIPIHVILNSNSALLGAACYGLERMRKGKGANE